MSISHTHLNGHPATADALAPLVFAGYAHFTAMQVRDHGVRGLDLHLTRLRDASDELFGHHLPDDRVRGLLSAAVRSAPPDVSLTCYVTSRPGEFLPAPGRPELDVLIKVTDPVSPAPAPLALDVVAHERHLPRVKHVGEVAKTQYLRRARDRGFDDAVFVDRAGRLSEATIWNLAFWNSGSVLWPEADSLPGITRQILARRLADRGIDQVTRPVRTDELDEGWAAVVMNSWSPGLPIGRIAVQPLADGTEFATALREAYGTEPLVTP